MKLNELRKEPHLSASAIGDYIECGMLYKFSRIDRLKPEFQSDSLVFGSVIHRVLAEFYRVKIEGIRIELKDLQKSFEQQWRSYAEGNDEVKYAPGNSFENFLTIGPELLTVWYDQRPNDDFTVLSVEEPFRFEVPNLPVPIIGVADLVEEDESGTIIVTDHKSSGRAYSADEIDTSPQLTTYQMAMRNNGYADREILLRFDCLIKTKKPKFEQYYTVRSEEDEQRLIRKAQAVWDGISKGVFVPNDQSWRHKNCPYRKACDRWFLKKGGDRGDSNDN